MFVFLYTCPSNTNTYILNLTYKRRCIQFCKELLFPSILGKILQQEK